MKENNLTVSQELYLEYLLQGYSQRRAYIKAFPKSKDSKPSVIDQKASTLFHLEPIQKRYNELKKKLYEELINKAIWTKEQSIYELQDILYRNKRESERYEEAYEDELYLINKKMEEIEKSLKKPKGYMSRKKKEELEKDLDNLKASRIHLNRRHQSNKSLNEAVLSSIQQLNAIHGYDKSEKDITVKAEITFIDDIPEED